MDEELGSSTTLRQHALHANSLSQCEVFRGNRRNMVEDVASPYSGMASPSTWTILKL